MEELIKVIEELMETLKQYNKEMEKIINNEQRANYRDIQ